jgi:hypothetical protein
MNTQHTTKNSGTGRRIRRSNPMKKEDIVKEIAGFAIRPITTVDKEIEETIYVWKVGGRTLNIFSSPECVEYSMVWRDRGELKTVDGYIESVVMLRQLLYWLQVGDNAE